MKIYNSYTDKLEEFKPINEGKVTMYVCGPTVYNYVHIGNMRPAITFDMVANYFKYLGYKVTYASNFTDINPKIISAAQSLGISEREVADKFIKAYMEDLKSYNCVDINIHPRVIDNLDNIFDFIQALIDKGYAYVNDGDVYFRVRKVEEYGTLSNQNIEDLESGARVEVDEKKEDPLDFALWRKTTEGEQFKSPWGMGIPGWHTECVVMINNLFGKKIDIHGGGVDLKFPHHENEIAQSEALNDNNLANYWMHNGHINVDGIKMSKSLGNFVLAKDFIKQHDANVIKIAMFKTHYRLPFNITDDLFKEAKIIDDKLKMVLKQATVKMQLNGVEQGSLKHDSKIEEIMDEDFNTPNLITYLSELIKELNNEVRNNTEFSQTYDKITLINQILGLYYDLPKLDEKDIDTYHNWELARQSKNYSLADELREILVSKNIL
jgi:cysteinyl-tRNA synthetase